MHFSYLLLTLASTLCSSALAAQLNVVAVGASITYGVKSSRGNGYRDDMLYSLQGSGNSVRMVGTQVGGTCYQPRSEGYPGAVISGVEKTISTTFGQLQYEPNVIVTLVGTNDMRPEKSQESKDDAKDRFKELLTTYRTLCPDCVIVASSLPPNGNPTQNDSITKFNKDIRTLVEERAQTGEHIVFDDAASRLTVADDMSNDEYHPNDQGYRKIGLSIAAKVQKAVDNGWTKSVTQKEAR